MNVLMERSIIATTVCNTVISSSPFSIHLLACPGCPLSYRCHQFIYCTYTMPHQHTAGHDVYIKSPKTTTSFLTTSIMPDKTVRSSGSLPFPTCTLHFFFCSVGLSLSTHSLSHTHTHTHTLTHSAWQASESAVTGDAYLLNMLMTERTTAGGELNLCIGQCIHLPLPFATTCPIPLHPHNSYTSDKSDEISECGFSSISTLPPVAIDTDALVACAIGSCFAEAMACYGDTAGGCMDLITALGVRPSSPCLSFAPTIWMHMS
jgi:hypothetical protein